MCKSTFHSSARSRDEVSAEDELEESSIASVSFLFSRKLVIVGTVENQDLKNRI